jgi:hypothetical protein
MTSLPFFCNSICNKNLRNLFLKDSKNTANPEPTANPTISKICGSPDQDSEEGEKFCCSLSEFKELYEQFHEAKIRLVRTRARIKRFFDYFRNLDKTEVAKMRNEVKSQSNIRKCVGPGYDIAITEINRPAFLKMLQSLNAFFDWKIEQLSSTLCIICSEVHPNYTIVDPIEMTLMVNLSQCLNDFQKYGELENVAYYMNHFLTLIKGLKCSKGEELNTQLKKLPNIAEWKTILQARDHCLDPRAGLHNDPKCADAFQGAANMMYFPLYEEFNFLGDYLLNSFQEYFGPTPKMANAEEQVKSITKDEEAILNNETLVEKAQWDFQTFYLYNVEEKWPIRFNVSCNFSGLKWPKYKMNMDQSSGFLNVLNKSIEQELEEQRKKLEGDVQNQIEASYLTEERESVSVFRSLFVFGLAIIIYLK